MDCKELKYKIYTNEILLRNEKEHIDNCPECKEVYEFNHNFSISLKKNLKYPNFTFSLPSPIFSKEKNLYWLLKPTLSYAFILLIGISLGLFVGNLIHYQPIQGNYPIQSEKSGGSVKINPLTPIATNNTTSQKESFVIPLNEDLKKELNIYGGVILLRTEIIKNSLAKCNNNQYEIDLKQNDIIIEINGKVVNNQQTLENNITSNCDSIVFKIMRNGKVIEKKYDLKIKR